MNKCYSILIKFFTWLSTLFFVVLFGVTHVLAWTNDNGITYESIGYVTSSTSVSLGTLSGGGVETIINTSVSTNYSDIQLKTLSIGIDYNFSPNTRYQIELHLPNLILNSNANTYRAYGYDSLTNSSQLCQISMSDSIFVDHYPRWDFECSFGTNFVRVEIANSSNNYITSTGTFRWNYAYLWYSNQRIGDNTQDIINNANANANNIINNQNQNTQDILNSNATNTQSIINNQNENTQQQIESQMACRTKILTYNDIIIKDKYLGNDGSLVTANPNTWGITDYIEIKALKIVNTATFSFIYSCFYDGSKTLLSCIPSTTNTGTITLPSGTKYARFSIRSNDIPEYQIDYCLNGNQAISDDINNLNDSITDSTPPDVSSLSNMAGWLPPGPVDSILTLPITFYNILDASLSGTCLPFSVNIPLVNQTLTLPCFSDYMSQHLPNFGTLWTFVGAVASVVILYRYLLSLYAWVDAVLMLRLSLHEDLGGNSANFGGV